MAQMTYYSKKYSQKNKEQTQAEPTQTTQMSAVAARSSKNTNRRMIKMGPMLLLSCLVLVLAVVLLLPMMVGGTALSTVSKSAASASIKVQQFRSFDSTGQAMQAADVQVALPVMPEGYVLTACRVTDTGVMELEFAEGKNIVLYRAANGSEDLSGLHYEDLSYSATESVDGVTRGYAGVSEKKLSSAVWVGNGYTYALVAPGGLEASLLRGMAESIH